LGNAVKSVTSGLCACVLTSSLLVVPPDHPTRPERQAVQLAAFTFPSTAQLSASLEKYLRDAAQTRTLVASVTPGGGPDAVAPPTFKSATDAAISPQQVIDAAPALALLDPGVYAGPLDLLLGVISPILGLLSSPGAIILFAPIFALILLSPIIVPVLFVVNLITGFTGGLGLPVPLAVAATFAAPADLDTTADPMSTDVPDVNRFATATTALVGSADAVSATETVQAAVSAQEMVGEVSETSTDINADEAVTEAATEAVEAEEDSATVAEATKTESDSTADVAEAAGLDDEATSKNEHAETAGTGKASSLATAADSHEPSRKPSSAGSSSAGTSSAGSSSANGDSSDGNSSGGGGGEA
jgi:uncharacterized membrane protein YgcG